MPFIVIFIFLSFGVALADNKKEVIAQSLLEASCLNNVNQFEANSIDGVTWYFNNTSWLTIACEEIVSSVQEKNQLVDRVYEENKPSFLLIYSLEKMLAGEEGKLREKKSTTERYPTGFGLVPEHQPQKEKMEYNSVLEVLPFMGSHLFQTSGALSDNDLLWESVRLARSNALRAAITEKRINQCAFSKYIESIDLEENFGPMPSLTRTPLSKDLEKKMSFEEEDLLNLRQYLHNMISTVADSEDDRQRMLLWLEQWNKGLMVSVNDDRKAHCDDQEKYYRWLVTRVMDEELAKKSPYAVGQSVYLCNETPQSTASKLPKGLSDEEKIIIEKEKSKNEADKSEINKEFLTSDGIKTKIAQYKDELSENLPKGVANYLGVERKTQNIILSQNASLEEFRAHLSQKFNDWASKRYGSQGGESTPSSELFKTDWSLPPSKCKEVICQTINIDNLDYQALVAVVIDHYLNRTMAYGAMLLEWYQKELTASGFEKNKFVVSADCYEGLADQDVSTLRQMKRQFAESSLTELMNMAKKMSEMSGQQKLIYDAKEKKDHDQFFSYASKAQEINARIDAERTKKELNESR